MPQHSIFVFFFFNDTATTEIYTLSLHDALPISLITFLFCGFWHGATPNFLLWGLYHAFGLIVFDLYRPGAMRRRLRRKGNPNAVFINRVEHLFGIALTFSFVSASWILFVFPVSRLL